MELDYVTLYSTGLFLLLTPAILTKTYLDFWLVYAWVFANIHHHFSDRYNITIPMQIVMEKHQYELIALIVLFSALMKSDIKKEWVEKTLKIVGLVTLSISVIVLIIMSSISGLSHLYPVYFSHFIGMDKQYITGLIPNKSMNAIFLVVLLPYMMDCKDKLKWWVFGLTTLLVILSESSTAYMTLSTFILISFWKMNNFKEIKKVLSLAAVLFVIGVAVIPDAFYAGFRFHAYELFFSGAKMNAIDTYLFFDVYDWLFGMGPAATFTHITRIQKLVGFTDNGYLVYFHSDPLQYIYEYGFLSVPLILWTIWKTFKRARGREILALSCLLTGSIFYYPFHFPTHLVIFFLIMKLVINEKNTDSSLISRL